MDWLQPLRRALSCCAFLFFAGIGGASAATIVTVGSGCTYASLQAAIDAIHDTGPTYEMHVRAGYVGPPISYSNKSIWIFGGYPSCNAAEPIPFDGTNFGDLSTIDGSLNPGHPGIEVSGNARLAVHNFNIHNATHPGANGGGISYNGSGAHAFLAIQSTNINHNSAERGAGVFFRSTATDSAMSIEHHTWLEFNTASLSGGGIRLEGNVTLTTTDTPVSISNNRVTCDANNCAGGGLELRDQSVANIGSPGWNGQAVIFNNYALDGGGVAVANTAVLNLYTAVPGQRARIDGNSAYYGGGVYIATSGGTPVVCLAGGGIDGNQAQRAGSAILVSSGGSTHIYADSTDPECNPSGLPYFAGCVANQPCNTMNLNTAPATGSVISLDQQINAAIYLRHIEMRSNVGGYLVRNWSNGDWQLSDCAIGANQMSQALVETWHNTLALVQCSIAGNAIASGKKVLKEDYETPPTTFSLWNTIVWEPNNPTLGGTGHSVRNVIAPDSALWNPADFTLYTNVSAADPQFVNVGTGDLHLMDASPAIDAAPTGTQYDLDNNPRGVDVAQGSGSPNLGTVDLGAYEVQHVATGVPVTFPPDETFDELGPVMTLPANWTTVSTHSESVWVLANDQADTGTYSAFAPDAHLANDATLTTTPFHVVHGGQVSFRHRVGLEAQDNVTAYDGARLEIRIGDEADFHEITEAGGQIVQGGYDHVIAQGVGNALPGAGVWSGDAPYASVLVALPHAANGQDVTLRWRVVTDQNNGWSGYWLDSIHVDPDDGQTDPVDDIFEDGFDPLPALRASLSSWLRR